MSAAAATAADDQRITDPQDERLYLRESATIASPIQADGTVLLHVIRPGVGKGRGRRYYSPEMLRENAHKWSGSRMFLNHETDKEAKERGHLPRKVEHLGGRILESWWDGDVPADDRFEQGAVVARVHPTKQVREMIEDDPELIETSINALATATRPGRVRGQVVALVEGIRDQPKPALDWIAGEGGAGGRVLLEASDQEEAVLESLNDDEFQEYLADHRPELLEALRDDSGSENDGNDNRQEEEVAEITAEVLQEALASDEGKTALMAALSEPMKEALQEALKDTRPGIDEESLNSLIESRLAEQADTLRIDARTDADRQIELRDMRDAAHSLVEAAKLHPRLKESIKGKYNLIDGKKPTDALNLGPETDEEGKVTKTAMIVLTEAVEQEIADARELQADLRPTRVRGQGAGKRSAKQDKKLNESTEQGGEKGGDGGSADDDAPHTTRSSLADELLLEAGFEPDALDSIYAKA